MGWFSWSSSSSTLNSSTIPPPLECFYCNAARANDQQRSIVDFSDSSFEWTCENCKARNCVESGNTVQDKMSYRLNTERFCFNPLNGNARGLQQQQQQVFCQKCIGNQNILLELTQSLPSSQSNREYVEKLEKRYPIICDFCQPKVSWFLDDQKARLKKWLLPRKAAASESLNNHGAIPSSVNAGRMGRTRRSSTSDSLIKRKLFSLLGMNGMGILLTCAPLLPFPSSSLSSFLVGFIPTSLLLNQKLFLGILTVLTSLLMFPAITYALNHGMRLLAVYSIFQVIFIAFVSLKFGDSILLSTCTSLLFFISNIGILLILSNLQNEDDPPEYNSAIGAASMTSKSNSTSPSKWGEAIIAGNFLSLDLSPPKRIQKGEVVNNNLSSIFSSPSSASGPTTFNNGGNIGYSSFHSSTLTHQASLRMDTNPDTLHYNLFSRQAFGRSSFKPQTPSHSPKPPPTPERKENFIIREQRFFAPAERTGLEEAFAAFAA